MPLYEVHHSVPLSRRQKTELASEITRLHTTTFTTPSLFVNLNFIDVDASSENYFIAGQPRPNGSNRITGMVRTSEKRLKKDFDALAEKIEGVWNLVVRGIEPQPENADGGSKEKDKKQGQPEESEKEREAMRLHAVFLYPMVAARESGFVIPTAGEEGQWLQSNMPEFKHRAETKGDEDMVQLLEEIQNRDDLEKLLK